MDIKNQYLKNGSILRNLIELLELKKIGKASNEEVNDILTYWGLIPNFNNYNK